MNIRNPRELKNFAAQRLEQTGNEKHIVFIYAALALGLSALVTLTNYVLGLQIGQSGGLGNLGNRTMLSALQNTIPIAQSLVVMCLEVGYLSTMLRIARGQYASPQGLRLGFDRFWVLLRWNVIKVLLLTSVVFVSMYLGVLVFMMTPFSNRAVEILTPYLTDLSLLSGTLELADGVYMEFAAAVVPAYVICGILACVLGLPMLYSYRMVEYVLIDKPAMGAMAALRESKKMMRGRRLQLAKLDVSLWWYYGAALAAYVVCYGDVILPMLGLELPVHGDVSYFIFFGVYLAVMFAVYYFLRNRVDVSYGLFYDSIRPEEKKDNGVVLGNIFNL